MAVHESPGSSRASEGLRCPTCGARQGLADVCRRCRTDLRLFRDALESYQRHRRSSLLDLQAGRLEPALRDARRCHELSPGPESLRLLAVCQLLRGDWLDAVQFARRVDESGADTDR
jgi:hypothetical protein